MCVQIFTFGCRFVYLFAMVVSLSVLSGLSVRRASETAFVLVVLVYVMTFLQLANVVRLLLEWLDVVRYQPTYLEEHEVVSVCSHHSSLPECAQDVG